MTYKLSVNSDFPHYRHRIRNLRIDTKSSLATELVGNERGSASVIIASLWRFLCSFFVLEIFIMKKYFVCLKINGLILPNLVCDGSQGFITTLNHLVFQEAEGAEKNSVHTTKKQ